MPLPSPSCARRLSSVRTTIAQFSRLSWLGRLTAAETAHGTCRGIDPPGQSPYHPHMTRLTLVAVMVLGLAGCAGIGPATDPLADVERLEDVALSGDGQAAIAETPEPPRGLLGRLFGRDPQPAGPTPAADVSPEGAAEDAAEGSTAAPVTAPRRGLAALFGRGPSGSGAGAGAGSAAQDEPDQVPPNTQQALGEIGRTCDLPTRRLGRKVAEASGYAIYDTIPNSTAPRPHYITGFSDGCARQFTGALVLLGDVGTHEFTRYTRTRADLPYSATDQAYEALKSSFCRVGFGQPCGRRLEALGRRTTFVTAYERFGGAGRWAEFLLSDGAVLATTVEKR